MVNVRIPVCSSASSEPSKMCIRDSIYLANAATAQTPACVIEAEKEFYEKHNANPLRGFYPLSLEATDAYEAARKTVQQFIHAASETEIIFTRNTTESLNLVAYSYGLNNLCPEDEIVVSIMAHHSTICLLYTSCGIPRRSKVSLMSFVTSDHFPCIFVFGRT